jgi:ParB family chromosome partitioning protein
LIQPITVRPIKEGKYQIISGERRFRASKLAGLKSIPAYIRETDDNGMLEMAIVENIQREDLDAIEVAVSFQRLIDECSLTQEAMADRVGKKRATVANYLRLLKLPAEIQFAIRAKKITMGHAKSLLGIENPKIQLKLANQIIEQDLSVRQIEAKVQKLNEGKKDKKEKETIELPDNFFKVIETLGKYFNNNISIKRSPKGTGELTIRFSSDIEMENFLKVLEEKNL